MPDLDITIGDTIYSKGSVEALRASLQAQLDVVETALSDLEGIKDILEEALSQELVRQSRRCGVCDSVLVDVSPLIDAAKSVVLIMDIYKRLVDHLPPILSTYGGENWARRLMETDHVYQCIRCGAVTRWSTHYSHVYERRQQDNKKEQGTK